MVQVIKEIIEKLDAQDEIFRDFLMGEGLTEGEILTGDQKEASIGPLKDVERIIREELDGARSDQHGESETIVFLRPPTADEDSDTSSELGEQEEQARQKLWKKARGLVDGHTGENVISIGLPFPRAVTTIVSELSRYAGGFFPVPRRLTPKVPIEIDRRRGSVFVAEMVKKEQGGGRAVVSFDVYCEMRRGESVPFNHPNLIFIIKESEVLRGGEVGAEMIVKTPERFEEVFQVLNFIEEGLEKLRQASGG